MMKLFVLVFLQISQADHAEVGKVDEPLPGNLDRDVDHLLVRGVQPQAVQGDVQVLVMFSMTRAIINVWKKRQDQHDNKEFLHICYKKCVQV